MSLISVNKSHRNGQVILNDDKKGLQKIKVILRRLLKRNTKRKMRRKIKWEEENDVIASFLRQRHSVISKC